MNFFSILVRIEIGNHMNVIIEVQWDLDDDIMIIREGLRGGLVIGIGWTGCVVGKYHAIIFLIEQIRWNEKIIEMQFLKKNLQNSKTTELILTRLQFGRFHFKNSIPFHLICSIIINWWKNNKSLLRFKKKFNIKLIQTEKPQQKSPVSYPDVKGIFKHFS